jgi:hypothetical protein
LRSRGISNAVDTVRVDEARSERTLEAAEAQLERFIETRHEKRVASEGERREEEMWKEAARRFNERERRQIRAEWYGWHCDQAERHRRTLERLVAYHEEKAQKLLEGEQEGAA